MSWRVLGGSWLSYRAREAEREAVNDVGDFAIDPIEDVDWER
jgi:hypothetical protein